MIKDKSFPFQEGTNWKIKNKSFWCIEEESAGVLIGFFGRNKEDKEIKTIDLSEDTPKIVKFDCSVIPCNYIYETQNFSSTPREVLEIFTKNNLEPIFDNREADNLYKKLYVDKIADGMPRLNRQLEEINAKIESEKKRIAEESQRNEKLKSTPTNSISKAKATTNSMSTTSTATTTKTFADKVDCQQILAKYDVKAVNSSAIKYNEAVIRVTTELLEILNEKDKTKAVAEQRRRVMFIKEQAEAFFKRMDEINMGYDSIRELAKLEAEPRPSFEFLVESLTRIINN